MPRITLESFGATEILVRNRARMLRLADLSPELDEATNLVYEATGRWYDSDGGGSWPPLAASTIAQKAAQGYNDPERPLFATGNLYESATSPTGPHSFKHFPSRNSVVIGVDWAEGGWQIPVVHFYGTDTIPARRIWPSHDSWEYSEMRRRMTELMLRGI